MSLTLFFQSDVGSCWVGRVPLLLKVVKWFDDSIQFLFTNLNGGN